MEGVLEVVVFALSALGLRLVFGKGSKGSQRRIKPCTADTGAIFIGNYCYR
jgi:hypothetical protein